MGLLSRLGKKLRVVGSGSSEQPIAKPSNPSAPARPAQTTWSDPPEVESPRGDRAPTEYIEEVVKGHHVVLFMKGSMTEPRCGFSANAAGILASYGAEVFTFDVLSDDEVREKVKEYSSWPTIPQVYIGGQFVGGSDILIQMHEAGELKALIEAK